MSLDINKAANPDTALEAYNEWRESQGLGPIVVAPKERKALRSLALTDTAWEGLLALAKEHKLRATRGPRSGMPSVAQLVEAIGQGVFTITLTRSRDK